MLEAAGPGPAAAQPATALEIDVPYLSQTEALCGGAAAAMLFRYWGDRYADVQQFAPLVDRRAGGIAQQTLVDAVRARGWSATTIRADLAAVRQYIRTGRPLILLIEDRPGRYHYVVAVAADEASVALHDPAWGPSRRFPNAALTRAWAATDFWALSIEPGPASAARRDSAASIPAAAPMRAVEQCDRLLEAALDDISAGGLAAADEILGRVRTSCPNDPRPVSELAGVRFAARRWREAADLAEEAAAIDPGNAYAWDVLGSSRFMMNDAAGALRAWNEVNKPRLDRVNVTGLERTRYALVVEALGLTSTTLLTADGYRLAERRLQLLPDRAAARIGFRPDAGGFAVVDVALAEKPGRPRGPVQWTAAAGRALIGREVSAAIPGRSGQGELWTASWRWWEERPRAGLSFSTPVAGGLLPGVWRVDGEWDEQAYGGNGITIRERRLHAGLAHTNWWTPDLRYEIGGGIDSWNGSMRTGSFGGLLEQRLFGDRLALIGAARAWRGRGVNGRFHTLDASARYRSRLQDDGFVVRGAGGLAVASAHAPRALWPGAGAGHARPMLLRAHPLLDDGVIRGPAFGRTLRFATIETERWFTRPVLPRLGVAAFMDTARSTRGESWASRPRTHVDLGAGVRIKVPGTEGTVRIDVARGLRDGVFAVTVGVVTSP